MKRLFSALIFILLFCILIFNAYGELTDEDKQEIKEIIQSSISNYLHKEYLQKIKDKESLSIVGFKLGGEMDINRLWSYRGHGNGYIGGAFFEHLFWNRSMVLTFDLYYHRIVNEGKEYDDWCWVGSNWYCDEGGEYTLYENMISMDISLKLIANEVFYFGGGCGIKLNYHRSKTINNKNIKLFNNKYFWIFIDLGVNIHINERYLLMPCIRSGFNMSNGNFLLGLRIGGGYKLW